MTSSEPVTRQHVLDFLDSRLRIGRHLVRVRPELMKEVENHAQRIAIDCTIGEIEYRVRDLQLVRDLVVQLPDDPEA